MEIRLGTRSSKLALIQARQVARMLRKAHPGLKVALVEIATTGDEVRDKPLRSFGGAGVFVKELERALLDKRIDLAVHSLKDMPTAQPAGLALAAVIGREDTRDAAVVHGRRRLEDLPAGSVMGSGSTRRRAQLKHCFPQLEFAEIRGNVETRIRKVETGQYAGTILARAGLRRLNLLDKITQTFPLTVVLPAPGQGALGLECRADALRVRRLLQAIHNPLAAACVAAERATLEALGGGCHLPLGALAAVEKVRGRVALRLRASLGLPDGSKLLRTEASLALDVATLKGGLVRARRLGRKAAAQLLAQGGREILKRLEAGSL